MLPQLQHSSQLWLGFNPLAQEFPYAMGVAIKKIIKITGIIGSLKTHLVVLIKSINV